MKRITIALATIGFSVGAISALPAATDPTVVMVPQLPGGIFVGGSVYYFEARPNNSDLDYASVNFGTSSTFFSELKEVKPEYDWGWGVNVGYIFPNTGNDVNLSYLNLDSDDTSHIAVSTTSPLFAFVTPVISQITALGFSGTFFAAAAKAEYDIDQVDLTAGQYIDIGCRLIAHPYAGLRWARVDRDLDALFVAATPTPVEITPIFATQEESNYSGIGPIMGMDASYFIYMGLGVVGHFDGALLVGNIDSETDTLFTGTIGETPVNITNLFKFKIDDSTRVVPVLDGKLGIDYTFLFTNSDNSSLTLEAGWLVSHYFNVVDRISSVSRGVVGTTPLNLLGRRTSDLGLQGPYVSLVFHE